MQKSALLEEDQDVFLLRSLQKRQDTILFIVTFVAMLGLTPLLIYLGLRYSVGLTLGAVAALIVAYSVVRWRAFGFFLIVVCVALIEQDPLNVNIFTDQINVYFWPESLTGIPERPIGLLFLLILLALLCAKLLKRKRTLYGGDLLWPFLAFLACIALGVVNGLSKGGDIKLMILEVRPFWYLFLAYLLAYNLVTQKSFIRAFFWIVIISAGIKGLQGCYIYFIVFHRNIADQNEIMAHEESFFFAALILLIIIFYLHDRYRPQLYAALAALPFVVIAMAANNRRADYIALLVGALVSWTLIFIIKKQARKPMLIGMIVFLLVGGSYVVAFGTTDHSWAAPARSIMSVVYPSATDARDANSNLYRVIEDFDLKFTAKQSFPLGYGFGHEFLQPQILPNILSEDPVYLVIPHNTIYWVWMRLGVLGFFVFWYLIGSIIIRGCLIVRQLKDPYLRTAAIYIVALTVMEIVVAYADYQLYAFRNMIYLGLLVGILLRLPTFDTEPVEPAEVVQIQPDVLLSQKRILIRGTRGSQKTELLEAKVGGKESKQKKRRMLLPKVTPTRLKHTRSLENT
jgi:O-antigen ligase/polysaccharide polymerase Wzy-like membrane protein